jgi:hypothetical protein
MSEIFISYAHSTAREARAAAAEARKLAAEGLAPHI